MTDDDNPEWTEADFARAQSPADLGLPSMTRVNEPSRFRKFMLSEWPTRIAILLFGFGLGTFVA